MRRNNGCADAIREALKAGDRTLPTLCELCPKFSKYQIINSLHQLKNRGVYTSGRKSIIYSLKPFVEPEKSKGLKRYVAPMKPLGYDRMRDAKEREELAMLTR